MTYTNKRRDARRLVPTGNVDDVLLTGKSHGKDLTRFQAIGLAVFGLCVVLGVGVPSIVFESALQSDFERIGVPYSRNFSSILFGSLMCLLGGAWIAMGLLGLYKVSRRSKRSKLS
jgi:hypothetical protein